MAVDPESKRLQILEPFAKWDGKDLEVHDCSADAATAAPAYKLCTSLVGLSHSGTVRVSCCLLNACSSSVEECTVRLS